MEINENNIKIVKSPITVDLQNVELIHIESSSVLDSEIKSYIEVEEND